MGQLRAQVGFQKEELGKAYKEVYQTENYYIPHTSLLNANDQLPLGGVQPLNLAEQVSHH